MDPIRFFTPLAVPLVGSLVAVSASQAPSPSAVLDQRVPAFLDRDRNDQHGLTVLDSDGQSLRDRMLGIGCTRRER